MRRINLLPDSYAAARWGRVRTWVCAAALLPAAAAATTSWYVMRGQLWELSQRIGSAEGRVATEESRRAAANKVEVEGGKLRGVLQVRAEAEIPLSTSAALAPAFNMVPETIQLGRVTLESEPPQFTPRLEAPVKAGRKGKSAPAAVPVELRAKPLRIELEGFALSDLEAARFVSALANHPLYRNVKLSTGRYQPVAGVSRFQFSINLEVPLDREFDAAVQPPGRATSAQPKGQAGAGTAQAQVQAREDGSHP